MGTRLKPSKPPGCGSRSPAQVLRQPFSARLVRACRGRIGSTSSSRSAKWSPATGGSGAISIRVLIAVHLAVGFVSGERISSSRICARSPTRSWCANTMSTSPASSVPESRFGSTTTSKSSSGERFCARPANGAADLGNPRANCRERWSRARRVAHVSRRAGRGCNRVAVRPGARARPLRSPCKRGGTATGIRTRVSGLRIRRPSPLDDSGV
jgi:hypothetical protein